MTGTPPSTSPDKTTASMAANEVRLSMRQWLLVGTIVAGLFLRIPILWQRIEKFDPGPDYRIPYRLSNDYWMVDRYSRHIGEQQIAGEGRTLMIGDSVVWGHYVSTDETVTHYLNQLAGEDRFANLGIDGIHPAALQGLIRSYGRAIADKNVILHCNLLWMSSPQHDLQSEKEFSFNHAELVPQFVPAIPCYRESFSNRIGIVVKRNVSFFGWTDHLRATYFDNAALPSWTMEHPYDNPVAAVTLQLPSADDPPSPEPIARPWTEKGLARFNPPWIELDTSFQWSCFRQTLETLQQRGNRVFVVIGPFNEHMLTDKSLEKFHAVRADAEQWFREHGIAYFAPAVLPSECYADASHPLAEGYARMAKELFEDSRLDGFPYAK